MPTRTHPACPAGEIAPFPPPYGEGGWPEGSGGGGDACATFVSKSAPVTTLIRPLVSVRISLKQRPLAVILGLVPLLSGWIVLDKGHGIDSTSE
ncbi:hypothetical protein GCM10011491_24660 [Brucella endophytica]|uniref:Uncharacterized protein n=1 Tax=Brucella endophytica TaxID=1963359 RepID=A0A916SEN6_9HYPH|nr:hypothetical protein GCM10011491_24660 [Brucella endophytica]